MEIRIYTPALRLSGLSDGCRHFRYTESLREPGTFQMRIPAAELHGFCREHVVRFPESDDGYVIERIRSDSGTGEATVEGRSSLMYFSRRILPGYTQYSGSLEDAILTMAEEAADAVPVPLLLTEIGHGAEASLALSPRTVLSGMQSLSRAGGIGLSMEMDPLAQCCRFSVRAPRERGILLADSAGNLQSITREEDFRTYRNAVTVGGMGGIRETVSAEGLTADGITDREEALREAYLDARSIDRALYGTEEAFREALRDTGRQWLLRHRPTRTSALFTDAKTAKLLRPGDICPVSDKELGRCRALCLSRTVQFDDGETHYSVALSLMEAL